MATAVVSVPLALASSASLGAKRAAAVPPCVAWLCKRPPPKGDHAITGMRCCWAWAICPLMKGAVCSKLSSIWLVCSLCFMRDCSKSASQGMKLDTPTPRTLPLSIRPSKQAPSALASHSGSGR